LIREFIITTRTLDNFIQPHHKILELGAGTGIYSFYFAEKGNTVIATDIVPKHVSIIENKLSLRNDSKLNIKAKEVNATDLSCFEAEIFDIVLCLGPMYHLTSDKDREKCLQESLRVLKKGGILATAYINKHYILNSVMTSNKKYLTKKFIDKILDTGVIREGEKECFWTDAYFSTPSEMELALERFQTQVIDHIATDSLSPFHREFINSLNEQELDSWIYYIEKSCREKSILGISNHSLLICQKNN
jgi:ubiquinone/menaquinone biosynthesis C-methylase UbiE